MKRFLFSVTPRLRRAKLAVRSPPRWALASLLACLSAVVMAQIDTVNVAYHQGQLPRAPDAITALGPDLFGDRINLYDGSFSFEHTDVSLPGDSALPVAVSRKWAARAWAVRGAMADWDVETPRVQGTFADPEGFVPWSGSAANRCSAFGAPPGVTRGSGFDPNRNAIPGSPARPLQPVGSQAGAGLLKSKQTEFGSARDFNSFEYWGGTYVIVPGRGSQEVLKRASGNALMPTDGGSYPLVTAQNWQIGCLGSLLNASGQGFTAVAPDGTRYRFDWYATRMQTMMRQGDAVLARNDHFVMATEVTDRFGNWVRYTYDPVNPMNLTRIESNDGRVITLSYANGRVSTVFDGTRTWAYQYASNGDLRFVVLPDQSRWSLEMRPMVYPDNLISESGPGCDLLPFAPGGAYIGRMTHPSGASGTFTSGFANHGCTNVVRSCPNIPGTSWEDSPIWPKSLLVQGLTKKEITGPGMTPMVWQYVVGVGNDPWGAWAPCTSCASSKVTTVTEPDGSVSRHTFGIRWRENEGQLLLLEEGAPSSTGLALRTTTYNYRNATGQQFPDRWGDSELFTSDYLSWLNRPQDSRAIVQQGSTFTWQADPGAAGFDNFAKPARSAQFSSLGYSRSIQTLYENNLSKWVLAQIKQLTDLGSGLVPETNDYDPATALRTRSYNFGLLKARYGYHPDGTLHTLADAVNPPTVLTNYWRGVPRNVALPDGSSESAAVNNLGLLTAHTNAAGTTTHFGYDAMGRLANIVYPPEPAGSYHPKFISHQQVPAADRGLEPGHWRQTITTGQAVGVRYFDALWRERLRYAYDAADEATTSSAVETRYDADGRKVFESYPERSLGSVNAYRAGHAWVHDALNRVLAHTQDSELGALSTNTEYLAGFLKRVTNPRGHATTFSHQAFDQPIEDHIASISAPQGVVVSIPRDVFGKPSAITRAGGGASATRSYGYDAHQRLCKTVEPETGATIQAYDAAGNLAWRANGQPFTGTSACDQGSVGAGSKTSFAHDSRRRLTSTGFGDGQPGISRSYTADSLLAQIVSSSFTWSYLYNNRRVLTQEQFSVPGQTPGAGWNFSRGIDTHGNLSSLADPWGTMNLAPNALGQATQVSGYASDVSYHPNGLVAGYMLANGVTRSVSLNLRGLPQQWHDSGVVNDLYSFDANGNVTGIQDLLQGVNTRSLGYDALDRLTATNGPWGSGQFGYDALDNLTTSQIGARTLTHHIDAATNRLTGLTGSQSIGIGYDSNGNVAQRGSQGFSFDIGNRLRAPWGKAIYDYDGHGRRSWVVFADGSTQLNAYSGTGAAGQLRFSNHSVKGGTRYVYLGDKLIAEHRSSGAISFSHTDALGSPVARSNAAGIVTERTRYEPYGATVAGSTNPTSIGFTGHVNDADTGLVYMQQRYYDPIAGRFLSVDPVTTDATTGSLFNRYNYAYNNPYRFKDPDGRFGVAGFLAGAAFEALAQWSVTGSVSDWKAVGVAGAVGVVTGGVGGYAAKAALTGATTAGKAIAATGLAGGAAAAGGKHAEAALKGETASAAEAGVAAAGGSLGAGAGAKIANSAAATLGKMAASKDGVVSGMAAATRGAITGGGPAAVSSTVGSEAAQKSIDAGVAVGQKMVEEKMK